MFPHFITFFFLVTFSNCFQQELIAKYFLARNVYVINIYSCGRQDVKSISRYFNKDNRFLTKASLLDERSNGEFSASHYVRGIFIDLMCDVNKNTLERIHNAYNTSFKWLLWAHTADRIGDLHNVSLSIDSDFVLALPNGTLYDISKIWPKTGLNFYQAGNWRRNPISFHQRERKDLKGITITGVLVLVDIEVSKENFTKELLDEKYFPSLALVPRRHFQLCIYLQQLYNFKVRIIRSVTWGTKNQKGEWYGMVADIANGTADLGLVVCQMMEERARLVNFLVSLDIFRLVFIFRQPKVLGTHQALVLPLSSHVWLALFGVVFISAIIYEMMFYLNKYKHRFEKGNGIVFVIAAIALQGVPEESYKLSNRIISISLLVLGLVTANFYNSSIMKGLLTPAPNSIQSLDQLIDSSIALSLVNIQYLTNKQNFDLYFLPKTREKIRKNPHMLLTPEEGIERVRKSKFALCGQDIALYPEIEKTYSNSEKCQLSFLDAVRPFQLALPIAKLSPFRDIITQGLLWLWESGVSDRLKKFWNPQSPACYASIDFLNIGLEAISVAIIILLIGMIFSVVVLSIEKFTSRYYLNIN